MRHQVEGGLILDLCPEKVAYLHDYDVLVCSDIHLGKTTHFRRSGIGIPAQAAYTDLANLNIAIEKYHPKKILLLGDLFHAEYNQEWDAFTEFMEVYNSIDFVLIKGNHDIISGHKYHQSQLDVVDHVVIDNVVFSHDALGPLDPNLYNIHGHIHPGVRLKGPSRQSLRLPCFWFGKQYGVMPAFGRLTGLAVIKPKPNDDVYVITSDHIMRV